MIKKLIVFFFIVNTSLHSNDPWTWVHHIRYNDIIRVTHRAKKVLFHEKEAIKPFTQLIFSWNAQRPEQGYFSFHIQVRNAETKRWGVWHHIGDWGRDVQQSYLSKSDGFSSFVHVRLEIEEKNVADAFRIKIIPHQHASLSLVHSYAVAVSDFNQFKPEQSLNNVLESVHIEGISAIAQFGLEHEDNGRICSPVSCAMLVDFLTDIQQDPMDFARQSFDTGLNVYGSWPYNIAHAFECCAAQAYFFVRRMNAFADIHQQLMQGMPVIVSVRGTLPGALKAFPHGHLMLVVGWDNETREVLCHDPAAEKRDAVFKRYPIIDFMRAWERSHRLTYQVEMKMKVCSIPQ